MEAATLSDVLTAEGFDVELAITEGRAETRVSDRGPGFDVSAAGHQEGVPLSTAGRGIRIMRTLMDRVDLESRPGVGTSVLLVKRLVFEEGSAGAALFPA